MWLINNLLLFYIYLLLFTYLLFMLLLILIGVFFRQIFDLIIAESQGVLICGGDFNIRLSPKLDSSKVHVAQPSHLNKKINLAMKDIGLIDGWRELNPLKRDYTYRIFLIHIWYIQGLTIF